MPSKMVELFAEDRDIKPVESQSLADLVYRQLRENLMRGRFQPHQRLKVRDLAAALGTSETPVREAIFQLVRDGAIELKPRHYIRVRRLTVAEYLEIRDIRLRLEPLAAERALPHIDEGTLDRLEAVHRALVDAEAREDHYQAIQKNFDFHFGIYWKSEMPVLIELLESLWIQVGPMLNHLYPDGRPTYAGRHQHVNVIEALRRRDREGLCDAIRQDLLEGGQNFLRHIEELERRETAKGADAAG
jgi:DNA-binding GntR family transcriptional regulator